MSDLTELQDAIHRFVPTLKMLEATGEGDPQYVADATLLLDAATKYVHLRWLVNEQAGDDGLWFVGVTAPEAYLMAALRRLHTAIEDDG